MLHISVSLDYEQMGRVKTAEYNKQYKQKVLHF